MAYKAALTTAITHCTTLTYRTTKVYDSLVLIMIVLAIISDSYDNIAVWNVTAEIWEHSDIATTTLNLSDDLTLYTNIVFIVTLLHLSSITSNVHYYCPC